MNKSILIFSLLIILSSRIYSQNRFIVEVGGGASLPSGQVQDDLELQNGWAGNISFEYSLDKEYSVYISSGYIFWKGGTQKLLTIINNKTAEFDVEFEANCIPVMVGGKYKFDSLFYGTVEIGINLFDEELTLPDNVEGRNVNVSQIENDLDSDREAKFGFGLGAGYKIPLSKKINLNITVKYVRAASDFNYINVGAAFGFTLL